MARSASHRITLDQRQRQAVAAMATALDLAADEFLSCVVAQWLAKPKRFRRFARRWLDEQPAATAGETLKRRKRVEATVASLKHAVPRTVRRRRRRTPTRTPR